MYVRYNAVQSNAMYLLVYKCFISVWLYKTNCPEFESDTGRKVFISAICIFQIISCKYTRYDKTGCGEEMYAGFFDLYGAPVNLDQSWTQGYKDIENQLKIVS